MVLETEKGVMVNEIIEKCTENSGGNYYGSSYDYSACNAGVVL